MDWQELSAEECLKRLDTDRQGLSNRKAEKKREKHGKNQLTQTKKRSIIRMFFAQFCDFMILILLAAAGVSFVTSYLQHDTDYVDSIIILAIVVVNAITGVVQESRAEKAIEALKKLAAPGAHVLRDGHQVVVAAENLVPGDIVLLSMGDLVPADLRLLETHRLKAEESALTGESLPVEKDASLVFPSNTPLGDRKNMAYMGSSISEGRGIGVVVATAMDTQVGKIAHMIHTEEAPQTPLQQKLAQTGKILGIGALLICLAIFVLGLFQHIAPIEMLLISISLAVAAIPEGLPAVVTIVLAIGVRRMAAKRAIVRRLPAVETLGSASVICSDKTGTLTKNKMTVVEAADVDGELSLQGQDAGFLLILGSLCNNCTMDGKAIHGNPTEAAILRAANKQKSKIDSEYPRINEIGFTSSRKRMTTVHRVPGGHCRIITKGAPDVLLNLCTHVKGKNGVVALTPSLKQKLQRRNEEMASRALRVLGIAYRDTASVSGDDLERDLVFCGLLGMIDPPRDEVVESVSLCKSAGIRTVMITGDHLATAVAIAKNLGILEQKEAAMTGTQLDALSQAELEKKIYDYSVYARVSPEHKVRIVKAFQARGEVVAMTGDGVNDAPALKAADIGCAMGMSGTDVAKAASDLILTDDNFSTIVSAVQEGRGIYANIRKTIHFLISCNIGEIITVLLAFILKLPTPLLAIQLLWVNLVTDSLPALALGVDPVEKDMMSRPPVKQKASIFSGGMGYNMAVEGAMIGSLALLAYTIGRVFFDYSPEIPVIGRTMAFAVLSFSQLVHTFNMRSQESIFKIGWFSNKKLVLAALACVVMQASVILIQPLSQVFKTQMLSPLQWLIVLGLSVLPLLVVELEKCFIRGKNKKMKQRKKSSVERHCIKNKK